MNGRKRHVLVDTLGLVLKVRVHAADVQDRDGARPLLESIRGRFPRLQLIWADSGYRGQLGQWLQDSLGVALEIVVHKWDEERYTWVGPGQEAPERPSGFHVLPHRWIVERTFGWLGRHRRMSKDYEYLTETSESMVYLAMTRLMVRRLAAPREET